MYYQYLVYSLRYYFLVIILPGESVYSKKISIIKDFDSVEKWR